MVRSEVFLLLPGNEKIEGQLYYYIEKTGILRDAELNDILKKIDETTMIFKTENTLGYYDIENIKAFQTSIRRDDNYPNNMKLFRLILKNWGENWRDEKKQKGNEEYMYYYKPIHDDT
ncbi:MAG: hypothetical protein LUC91_02020, partial [Prevotella sp.]|nr:hypothetical protein [Prevotella sp.]